MRPTFCWRFASSLGCIFLSKQLQPPHLTPASKFCVTSAKGCVSAQQASMHAALQNKAQKKIRAALRNWLTPVWALEPPFSCFGDKFQSIPAKECHCSAPRHYGGKRSARCHGLAVTFLSLPACKGVGEQKALAGDFFPISSNHTLMLLSRPAGLFRFVLPRRNACV